MKTTTTAVALLTIAGVVTARETRTEVTRATTPADDAKPNSNKVPDVYPIERKFVHVTGAGQCR